MAIFDNFQTTQKIIEELTGYQYNQKNSYIINEIRNLDKEEYPSIFYVGGPKSASTSIVEGFIDNKTAHWHDVDHVKTFHKSIASEITQPKDIFDLVRVCSSLLHKKCLLIESYREPIGRAVSLLFHDLLTGQLPNFDPFADKKDQIQYLNKFFQIFLKRCVEQMPYAQHWECASIYDFDQSKGFYYKECVYIKYMMLIYEHIEDWNNIIHSIGYSNFQLPKTNITLGRQPLVTNFAIDQYNDLYMEYTKNLKFNQEILDYAYDNTFVKLFYKSSDIQNFYKKYS